MKPSDSIHPQLYFTAHGYELAVALMDIENPSWPDIVYPVLFKKVGIGQWVKIDERQPMWEDLYETFTPENMAKLIVDDFNITIETLRYVEEKTWVQKLAAVISELYHCVADQLVKKL